MTAVIPHEEAAKKVHPTACHFRPVTKSLASSQLVGWIFEVKKENENFTVHHTWVTTDGMVSSDLSEYRTTAARQLRVFCRNRPRKGPVLP